VVQFFLVAALPQRAFGRRTSVRGEFMAAATKARYLTFMTFGFALAPNILCQWSLIHRVSGLNRV
jgi:hypothetical protein